jgi:2'-5' RNA ligase
MERSRFFIALMPPQHIQDHANQIKQHFAGNYASSGAQKSPPHITLQPPFEWANENISQLEECLANFARERKSVPITLKGFAAFAPRVVYINVLKTPDLLTLQADLMAHMEVYLGITDPVSKTRPFAPHLTVAFRDLTKSNFKAAWAEFEHQQVDFDFAADRISLLLHDGKRWNVKTDFEFINF